MGFSPVLLLFSGPDTGPKSQTISRAQPIEGSRVQIHLAPPTSLRYSAFFRETRETRLCAASQLLKVTGESPIGEFFGRSDAFLSASR